MILQYTCKCGHEWFTDWSDTYADSQQDSCPRCDTLCDPDETKRIFELTPVGWFACVLGEDEARLLEKSLAHYMRKNKKRIICTDIGLCFDTDTNNPEEN